GGGKQPPLPRRGPGRPPVPGAPAAGAGAPWPGDATATGAVPQVSAPAPSAPPAPAAPSAPANGAAPWPGEPQAPVDDWPGGSSTTSATPWPGGQNAGGGAQQQKGNAPWPGGASAAGAGATTGAMQHPTPGVPAGNGAAPWPTDAQTTGTTPWPGDASTTGTVPQPPAPGAHSAPANGAAPWPGEPQAPVDDWPGGSSTTSATPWPGGQNAGGGAQQQKKGNAPWPGGAGTPGAAPQAPAASTTQQFPAPTIGGVPAGGAAFAGARTDTPREGFPAVQAPGPQGAGKPAAGRGNGQGRSNGQAQGNAQGRGGAQAQGNPQGRGNGQAQGNAQAQGGAQAQGKGKKKRGPKNGAPASAPAAGPVGQTLVGGVPPVPPAAGQGPRPPVDSGAPRVPVPKPKPAGAAAGPAPAAPAVPKPPAKGAPKAPAKAAPKSAPKKKGRSKLVLLGGGLVGLVGLAYGAGLLLDHADVPNGTTVLGVDIGGKSKEQAVQKLDSALGQRTGAPLKVSIGGKTADLKPSVAGLSIDTQATVRAAAGRDYNPVTVLGSLIGQSRTAEPTVIADEEKIAAAIKTLAGETGTAKDGSIKFEPGKAVPVYGQPYKGVDVDSSVKAVSKAFRDRAATGTNTTVVLATSDQQPKVANAEVDRMMKDFATPAMSGLVTIQTDPAHKINFGPDRSLPKILSVKEVNGKLVESYDLEAIKELYGSAFNGVLITRGNGSKTPVQPTDVAGALGKALRGKTPAERIVTITQG
ncbi:hypothetical protein AB0K89_30350, partial [Streptomyces cinnamoneus]|uniref:hypothetical protein n=1 Tax=Streptomyces cinnamoneus TaxID=53446 RepID=UPI003423B061